MVAQRRRWRYGHGSLVCSDHLGTLVGEEGHKRRTMMGGRGMALTPCHPCWSSASWRTTLYLCSSEARVWYGNEGGAHGVSPCWGHATCCRRPRTPGASAAAGLWPRQHELGANDAWRLHLASPWQRAGTLASPTASSAFWSSGL